MFSTCSTFWEKNLITATDVEEESSKVFLCIRYSFKSFMRLVALDSESSLISIRHQELSWLKIQKILSRSHSPFITIPWQYVVSMKERGREKVWFDKWEFSWPSRLTFLLPEGSVKISFLKSIKTVPGGSQVGLRLYESSTMLVRNSESGIIFKAFAPKHFNVNRHPWVFRNNPPNLPLARFWSLSSVNVLTMRILFGL